MLDLYKQTELEKKIEKIYIDNGIFNLNDLEVSKVASALNIGIEYTLSGPSRVIWDEDATVIFLNGKDSAVKQREIFFHELAHPILHCGDQTYMHAKEFREYQEQQANQFQLYAAIPFFMLKELELPKYEKQAIYFIAAAFKVSIKLAKKRIDQIKRRITQRQMDELVEPVYLGSNNDSFPLPILEELFTPLEIKRMEKQAKKESRPKVYYSFKDNEMVPIWYVIEVTKGQINWGKESKLLPIDADFDIVPVSEFEEHENDANIVFDHLSLNPLFPNDFVINTKLVKQMLHFYDIDPYNVNRLVIDALSLEEVLQMSILDERIHKTRTISSN